MIVIAIVRKMRKLNDRFHEKNLFIHTEINTY